MMKKLNIKLLFCFLLSLTIWSACKEDKTPTPSNDVLTSQDFIFNLATKKIMPGGEISTQITADVAIDNVYCYLVRTGKTDSLVHIEYGDPANPKQVIVMIPADALANADLTGATGIKLLVKHGGSSYQGIVKLSTFAPPLPTLTGFPETKLPDDQDKINITGVAASENGISKIEIMDNSTGVFTVVNTIDNLNNVNTYNVDYTYTYRANTSKLKIVVTDNFNLSTSTEISVPVLPYTYYKDVNMNAQSSAINNFFIAESGKILGSCDLSANEQNISFLFYGTSSGPTFYSPTNVGNIAKNYKCSGTAWTPAVDVSTFRATRFRILTLADNADVYAKITAQNVTDLTDDGLFSGIAAPSSSTSKYDPAGTPGSVFNTTSAYLIWAKVPSADGQTSKNVLLHIKECVFASTAGLSTVKMDIYVQK